MNKELIIRHAEIDDLSSIVSIYNQAIRSGYATGDMDEFRMEDRVDWFNKFDSNEYPLYVAEIENSIVGYCTISPYRPGRQAMSSVAEISYYLDFSFHGKGIGSSLLKFAISDCKRIGKESLLAILMDCNTASIKLLEKFNFEKWGHLPDIINIKGKIQSHLIYDLKIS